MCVYDMLIFLYILDSLSRIEEPKVNTTDVELTCTGKPIVLVS